MSRKKLELNKERVLKSAIFSLQQAYLEYKKSVIKSVDCSWITDDGDLALLEGQEERNKAIIEADRNVQRLKAEVEKLKKEIAEEKG